MHSGYYGASDDLHIGWLQQMHKTVTAGFIPPRYVPDLSYGFGYPLFNFVFPLPFYLGEIVHAFGFTLVDSIKVVFALSIILSGLFMYWSMRKVFSNAASFIATILYIYTPYRATEIYIRGAIGEAFAFVFFPLIVGGLIALVKNNTNKNLAIVAIGVGLLVLSHNISAYMFIPFAVLLGIILQPKKPQTWIYPLLLGSTISMYFWLPALRDSRLLVYDTVFNYWDHFPTLKQLLIPNWGWGASVPGPYDGMSFFIGTVNLCVLIISIPLFFFLNKKFSQIQSKIFIWAILAFVVAFVCMNFRSAVFWEVVPLIKYFQFPWRFLLVTSFCSSIIAALVVEHLKLPKYMVLILPLLLIGTESWKFNPHDFLARQDNYYLNRYIPYPFASYEYTQTSEEYLRLPKNTQIRPNKIFPRFYSDNIQINQLDIENDFSASVNITSPENGSINYNKYAFPGWKAKLDGEMVRINPGEPFGQINISIPAGTHNLHVFYEEPKQNWPLDIMSAMALIYTIFRLIYAKK